MTTRTTTKIETVHRVLTERPGEPMSTTDVTTILDGEMDERLVAANLSSLRKRREVTGVIRIGSGVYKYDPDHLSEDIGDGMTGDVSSKVLDALKQRGQATTAEIAEMAELTKPQVSSTMTKAIDRGEVERIRPGTYRWLNGSRPGHAPNPEFLPVIASIPEDIWAEVGMNIVGRTKDSDLIGIDGQGTAWRITVTIDSTLL